MNIHPKVLIFDDQPRWAEQIALSLKNKFLTTTISNPDRWNKHISSTYWDAIIVDVDILGDNLNGPERAEQSILEYGMTSPIIVISGVVNLKDIEKKHGNVFFAYVHKDNYNEQLPTLIESACTEQGRCKYIHGMLIEFGKRFSILDNEFPKYMITDKVASALFDSNSGRTINDLISTILVGTKNELSKMGKIILEIIRYTKIQKEKT